MNVKPILFQPDMVRALLEGRKSQTRRMVKPQPIDVTGKDIDDYSPDAFAAIARHGPYGKPGDLLYVREPYYFGCHLDAYSPSQVVSTIGGFVVNYITDDQVKCFGEPNKFGMGDWGRYRHARFMPRTLSRLTLKITDIRVERVQDISIQDVFSEGVRLPAADGNVLIELSGKHAAAKYLPDDYMDMDREKRLELVPRAYFASLWDSIDNNWDDNPWVWCVSFEVIKQNIDEYLKDNQ